MKNYVVAIGASRELLRLGDTRRPGLDAVAPLGRVLERIPAEQSNMVAAIDELGYGRLTDDTRASGHKY